MSFKMKGAPYCKETLHTPVYHTPMDDNTRGMATKNGSILINEKLSPLQEQETYNHEKTHNLQVKEFHISNGEKGMDYEDDYLLFDGVKYPRKDGKILYEGQWREEGWPGFKWEKEAYQNQ
tara:strand:+ start:1130 stop:1492 length:363 start_codon:yes stop_codon:yes gene_type:complete